MVAIYSSKKKQIYVDFIFGFGSIPGNAWKPYCMQGIECGSATCGQVPYSLDYFSFQG